MLGAPGEDLSTVLGWLADAGATAVELRVAAGQPVEVHSPPEVRAGVRSRFAEARIEVLACASYVRVGADLTDDEVEADLVEHLQLAADVGARFLRVFPGAPTLPGPSDRVPEPVDERSVGDARIVARLAAVAGAARELGVRPVLETHDSHPRGQDVARVLHELDQRAPGHTVGALWDVVHPFRTGEHPQRTWDEIGPRLVHGGGFVQFKDVASAADETPVLIGAGAVPLAAIVALLEHGGYDGPLSLEWERTWYPDIEPLPLALASMTRWLADARRHPSPAPSPETT